MKNTTNYGLKKPEPTDLYDIQDLNANADTIDTKLKELEDNKAESEHLQSASTVTAGTFGGAVVANASTVANLGTKQVRNIYAGTTEMVAGTSTLPAGDIYVQLKV